MAQPSANREPTMEEILASIRRIIESNDAEGADGASPPENDDEAEFDDASVLDDLTASNDDGLMAVEHETEIAAQPVAAAGGSAGPAARTVSLADVAARVRASGSAAVLSKGAPAAVASLPARGNAAVRIEQDFAFSQNEAAPEETVVPAASPEAEKPEVPEPDLDLDALSADLAGGEAKAASNANREGSGIGNDAAEPASGQFDPFADDGLSAATDAGAGTHLMSAQAGAKVTAAFEDLNDVFLDGPRRSFDEMAEEMLRPMLQQWLDDNLPTLVERLVREEIERVARGSRR